MKPTPKLTSALKRELKKTSLDHAHRLMPPMYQSTLSGNLPPAPSAETLLANAEKIYKWLTKD